MPARKMGREVGKVGTAIRPQCRSGPVKERGKEVSDDDAVLQGFNQTDSESSTQSSSSLIFQLNSLWLRLCYKI